MTRTLEQIGGEPPRLRLTFTENDGTSMTKDLSLEEADELGRDLVVMVHRGRRARLSEKNYTR